MNSSLEVDVTNPIDASMLKEITPSVALTIKLNTPDWFDGKYQPAKQSSIDEFLENLYSINRLYLQADDRGEYSVILGSLAYMGMVSAVESYFRSLLRQLILTDDLCMSLAASRPVTYAAAIHHERDLLPEALLEGVSFASVRSVAVELKTLCNITQMTKDGGVPHHLKQLFDAFESVCQVRHCGIHRFGKLGSNQALRLGMEMHRDLLEKPLALRVIHLQDIALALEALIRGVNSHCFADIIKRTHTCGPGGKNDKLTYGWSWQRNLAHDREKFSSYYSIFASTKKPHPSPALKDMYYAFLTFMKECDVQFASNGLKKKTR